MTDTDYSTLADYGDYFDYSGGATVWANRVSCTGKEAKLGDCFFPENFGDLTNPYDYAGLFTPVAVPAYAPYAYEGYEGYDGDLHIDYSGGVNGTKPAASTGGASAPVPAAPGVSVRVVHTHETHDITHTHGHASHASGHHGPPPAPAADHYGYPGVYNDADYGSKNIHSEVGLHYHYAEPPFAYAPYGDYKYAAVPADYKYAEPPFASFPYGDYKFADAPYGDYKHAAPPYAYGPYGSLYSGFYTGVYEGAGDYAYGVPLPAPRKGVSGACSRQDGRLVAVACRQFEIKGVFSLARLTRVVVLRIRACMRLLQLLALAGQRVEAQRW